MKTPNKKVAFFCTANDAYVKKCIVTLLSFRQFYPREQFFVVGSWFSGKSRNLMYRHGIRFVEVPHLNKTFFHRFKYPRECYFHFYGPYLFKNLGFRYSVFLDGDLLCNGRFDRSIKNLCGKYYGARPFGVLRNIFSRDLGVLKRAFARANWTGRRPQSGVLFYNNYSLWRKRFFSKIKQLYWKSLRYGVPRKGDDSLLALFQAVYGRDMPFTHLSPAYNVLETKGPNTQRIFIYHFHPEPKPWLDTSRSSPVHRALAAKWKRLARRHGFSGSF